MAMNQPAEGGILPSLPEKELSEMNRLMMDREYRIKPAGNLFKPDRADRVNPEFILYTLNDYLGHIQNCVASTRKMIPLQDGKGFNSRFASSDPLTWKLITLTAEVDLRQLSSMLRSLQVQAHELSVSQLTPYTKQLFRFLIRAYYLGPANVAKHYRHAYSWLLREVVPADAESLKNDTLTAIEEWHYVFSTVVPGLYPLVLRMCSSTMLSMNKLFYANGSKVLAWLDLRPADVLIATGEVQDFVDDEDPAHPAEPPLSPEDSDELSPAVRAGLALLELLFPEAGWSNLESMPDMCPYYQPIVHVQDAFVQLSPSNPLHQTMILFWILREFFQGMRHIVFEVLPPETAFEEPADITEILEDWVLYQEAVFDKEFSDDLKSYTHQIYTQPDFYKTPYGRKLLSNLYTMIKTMFLPYFDIRMYGTSKAMKDDRLPPFFSRVKQLHRIMERYCEGIDAAHPENEADSSVPGIANPWDPYRFEIPNVISKRMDALFGGKTSKIRTNAFLIKQSFLILSVLNWWINDRDSYAYRFPPEYLYRVVDPGSSVPAFGVNSRTDTDALFGRVLRQRQSL